MGIWREHKLVATTALVVASRIRKVEKGQKMTTKDARRLWLAVALVATANMGARADEVDNCVTE